MRVSLTQDLDRELVGYALTPEPAPHSWPTMTPVGAVPHRWQYDRLRSYARRLVESRHSGPQLVALANPGLGGAALTLPTLCVRFGCILPGKGLPLESSPGITRGIRLIREGTAVEITRSRSRSTTSEGRELHRVAGRWENRSTSPVYFVDVVDRPLIHALGADSYTTELHPSDVPRPCRPTVVAPEHVDVYKTRSTLISSAISCRTEPVAEGTSNPGSRSSASRVFLVLDGSGTSVMDGWKATWRRGDIFVVPRGCAVEHRALTDSHLFTVCDTPLMDALGLLRNDELPQPQDVHGDLD